MYAIHCPSPSSLCHSPPSKATSTEAPFSDVELYAVPPVDMILDLQFGFGDGVC